MSLKNIFKKVVKEEKKEIKIDESIKTSLEGFVKEGTKVDENMVKEFTDGRGKEEE